MSILDKVEWTNKARFAGNYEADRTTREPGANMGIKFGEIDSGQILENEYRIKVLERLVEWLMNNNSQLNKPDLRQMEAIRNDVVRELQVKYPQSGIKRMG